MFNFKLLNEAVLDVELTDKQFRMLYLIANKASMEKSNTVEIHNGWLMDNMNISERWVKDLTKSLSDKGYLKKTVTGTQKNRNANKYTLRNMDKNEECAQKCEEKCAQKFAQKCAQKCTPKNNRKVIKTDIKSVFISKENVTKENVQDVKEKNEDVIERESQQSCSICGAAATASLTSGKKEMENTTQNRQEQKPNVQDELYPIGTGTHETAEVDDYPKEDVTNAPDVTVNEIEQKEPDNLKVDVEIKKSNTQEQDSNNTNIPQPSVDRAFSLTQPSPLSKPQPHVDWYQTWCENFNHIFYMSSINDTPTDDFKRNVDKMDEMLTQLKSKNIEKYNKQVKNLKYWWNQGHYSHKENCAIATVFYRKHQNQF